MSEAGMRLSSQDVMWLVLVAALAAGWWLDSQNQRRTISEERDNAAILRDDIKKLDDTHDKLAARILELESKVVRPN